MKVLFVSNDLIAGNLALILKNEGNDIRFYIHNKDRRRNFNNLIEKTDNWKKELEWVGKDGLIVFDDVLFGKEQNRLRKQGYSVFGGSELGDKFELDREYGQEIFKKYGLKTAPLKDFDDVNKALKYVKRKKCAMVIKQNNHHYSKFLNYVGEHREGKDVISILESNTDSKIIIDEIISLHHKVEGVEIGVGRYFNGNDWVGPIEFNLEHTRLFPKNIGPMTSEMGTLAWYSEDEDNKLYKETLARLKPYLKKIDFRGDIEINNIVNKDGAFALEATARFGSPIIHLHAEIHKSPWGEFLKAVADGEDYRLKYNKGYGIVTLIATPPFPYGSPDKNDFLFGTNILFDSVTEKEFESIHFEEVSLKKVGRKKHFYVSDNRGYILYITGIGKTVELAQKKVKNIIKKIVIPKMFYREDIGDKFILEEKRKLEKWGYL